MKFRGVMVESNAMREFMNVTACISRFSDTCVLRITKKNMYFIISEEGSGPHGPLAWCELPVSFYFKEYSFAGVSDDYDEIFLEFSSGMLSRTCAVLKQDVSVFKIKLANKDTPCLTLDIDLTTSNTSYDIPVDVISRKYWSDYNEPQFDEYHASIHLPNLKSIKNITEKMKNSSPNLTVSARKTGELILQIKTNVLTLAATFPNLSVNSFADGNTMLTLGGTADKDQIVSSTVDIKKFLQFIAGFHINGLAVCNIIHEKMVKLILEQPGVVKFKIFLTEVSI